MNVPIIYDPITRLPIQLYSEEVNELLQKGYDINYLLSRTVSESSYPLTKIEDVDYQILMEMNYNELKKFCNTDIYTNKLCKNSEFWIKKMIHDGLHLPDMDLLLGQTNWLKVYHIVDLLNIRIEKGDNIRMAAILNTNNKANLLNLVIKYNLPADTYDEWYYIVYQYRIRKSYNVLFNGIENNQIFNLDDMKMDYQELFNFLFDAMVHNVITYIEEEYMYIQQLKKQGFHL